MKNQNNIYKEVAPYLTLGFQLAAAVVVFFLIGNWIDGKYSTAPYGKLFGALFGMVGGFYKFFKTVATLTKNDNSKIKK